MCIVMPWAIALDRGTHRPPDSLTERSAHVGDGRGTLPPSDERGAHFRRFGDDEP